MSNARSLGLSLTSSAQLVPHTEWETPLLLTATLPVPLVQMGKPSAKG